MRKAEVTNPNSSVQPVELAVRGLNTHMSRIMLAKQKKIEEQEAFLLPSQKKALLKLRAKQTQDFFAQQAQLDQGAIYQELLDSSQQNYPETTAVSHDDLLRYSGYTPSQDLMNSGLQMQTFADETYNNDDSSHDSKQDVQQNINDTNDTFNHVPFNPFHGSAIREETHETESKHIHMAFLQADLQNDSFTGDIPGIE